MDFRTKLAVVQPYSSHDSKHLKTPLCYSVAKRWFVKLYGLGECFFAKFILKGFYSAILRYFSNLRGIKLLITEWQSLWVKLFNSCYMPVMWPLSVTSISCGLYLLCVITVCCEKCKYQLQLSAVQWQTPLDSYLYIPCRFGDSSPPPSQWRGTCSIRLGQGVAELIAIWEGASNGDHHYPQ